MEFLYKLDLPPLTEVIREDIRDRFFRDFYQSRVSHWNADQILRPEFLNIKGLTWPTVNLFCKTPNSPGIVHLDNPYGNDLLHINILWVHGYGGMKFWADNNIDQKRPATDTHSNLQMTVVDVSNPPSRDYKTVKDSAYLLNASVAHTGYNEAFETENRYTVSLRCWIGYKFSWPDFVNIFEDLII